jgi:hypothetical protein
MVVYAIDGLIFLIGEDWLALGFYASALLGMFIGLQGGRNLIVAERELRLASGALPALPTSPESELVRAAIVV